MESHDQSGVLLSEKSNVNIQVCPFIYVEMVTHYCHFDSSSNQDLDRTCYIDSAIVVISNFAHFILKTNHSNLFNVYVTMLAHKSVTLQVPDCAHGR